MSYQTNRIEFTGKWLYYGLLSVIMMHDMYMWKKQIFYQPFDYGQYTDREGNTGNKIMFAFISPFRCNASIK